MIWRFREPNHLYFKTSYVEVYLVISGIVAVFYEFQNILCWSLSQGRGDTPHIYHIPKHLMLKFIQSQCHTIIPRPVFQNILCWSLSWCRIIIFRFGRISKHLMLKFIKNPLFSILILASISKHLMLKFILVVLSQLDHLLQFQNILCWSLSSKRTF